MLDVNQSSTVSRLEFKTGIQQLGLHATASEFESLWYSIYKPVNQMQHDASNSRPGRMTQSSMTKKRLEPDVEQADYLNTIRAFANAGCLKLRQAQDHQDTLLSKFRSQLAKTKPPTSVEMAYKIFDPNNYGSVQKKDFVHDCKRMGLQFSDEELVRLFDCICE